jgi:hypothetical protein
VTFDDGTAVPGGLVVFECQEGGKIVMARGAIQADGRYELSTYRPGDGALPGKYQVRVLPPPPDVDAPRKGGPGFDPRYTEFSTSGLTFEVKAGTNEFPIKLDRAGPPRP